jgi:hypothetical protein
MNPPTPSTSNQMPPTMEPREMTIEQIPGAAFSFIKNEAMRFF